MNKLILAATLSVLASAASAHLYEITPGNCAAGAGAADNIEVRNGYFRIGEDHYTRVGKKRGLEDGFFEGDYGIEADGEVSDPKTFKMRIRPNTLDLIAEDGTTTWGKICPE